MLPCGVVEVDAWSLCPRDCRETKRKFGFDCLCSLSLDRRGPQIPSQEFQDEERVPNLDLLEEKLDILDRLYSQREMDMVSPLRSVAHSETMALRGAGCAELIGILEAISDSRRVLQLELAQPRRWAGRPG